MDYEVLLKNYEAAADRLKVQIAQQQKLLKRMGKSMEVGDVRGAGKDLAQLAEVSAASAETINEIESLESGVDMASYLSSGDFAKQLVEACKTRGIDIIGEENNYEIFPYRLKINAQDEELLINGKKAPGLRPAALADMLETGRNKLLAANFNSEKFAAELAAAYDVAIAHGAKGKKPVADADVYLNTLYKYLAPMARFRRDHGAQSFAFDIARLYSAGDTALSDGRHIQFGPSRNNNRAIRILDADGREFFLATVRFYTV
jgi:DNA polymerase I-like protein with 3'-5' exonuclease and polymerase domains